MYISKVVLENFQAFERGEFNLSPNLNILVGVSNVGKSSVARALSLVLFNQWDKSWCRFGTKYCRVTILTNTGIEVIREKGDKINRYILRLPGQAEQLFESFGTTVPEQIQQSLKIHAVQVDTTDTLNLNLAGQMDALFLLSQTGSYRAKVLGKLSGATYLDHAIRKLNTEKRQLTAQKDLQDNEVVKLQQSVDKISGIETCSAAISDLESKVSSVLALEQRVERIRNLLGHVKTLKDNWTKATQKTALLDNLDLNSINQFSGKVDKIKGIRNLFTAVQKFKQNYLREDKIAELLKTIDLSGITILGDRVTRFKAVKDLATKKINNYNALTSKTKELQQIEQQHSETVTQFTDMLTKNGVCPLCNKPTAVDSCAL